MARSESVQNERQPRNTATIRPATDMDHRHFLREHIGTVSVVSSHPELPPREESPLSIAGTGRTGKDKVSFIVLTLNDTHSKSLLFIIRISKV
ncbi:hypothetical protein V3C99_018581 [Haemonchus contortus]